MRACLRGLLQTLGCASYGKMQHYSAGMQAMQDHEKNFNRGLGWVGEICAVDAEGCEAHQNWNLNEKLVHLHCLKRGKPQCMLGAGCSQR